MGVCRGNILDYVHLHAFKATLLLSDEVRERARLRGWKIAAIFFSHVHVVALHVANRKDKDDNGNAWIKLRDLLPNPEMWVVPHPQTLPLFSMSSDWQGIGSQCTPWLSGGETDVKWEHDRHMLTTTKTTGCRGGGRRSTTRAMTKE